MWWADLGILRQVMFIFGCCAGGILILQIIMTLLGLGHDSAFDFDGGTEFDGTGSPDDVFNNDGAAGVFGLKLLSARSIIAFLGIGAWMLFIMASPEIGWPVWGAVLISVAAGLAAAALMAYALISIEKLQSSGNISIENAVGKTGDVYLVIPAARSGRGKIQITVQERLREYDALTDGPVTVKTGEKIKVVGIIDEGTLLVEPFGAPTGG